MFTKAVIEKYFNAEKQESLLFIILGVAAIIAGLFFLFVLKKDILKGSSFPLILVGIIQLVVGYSVFNRSDKDRLRVVNAFEMNPLELKQNEIPRMEIVNRNFIIYRWVEIVLSIIGLVCIYFFKGNLANVFWFGFGIALFAQAIIMLCADYFAEQRALIYTKGLQNFVKGK